jgi:hypothetical protein
MVIYIFCLMTGGEAIVACFKLISAYSPEESDDNLLV